MSHSRGLSPCDRVQCSGAKLQASEECALSTGAACCCLQAHSDSATYSSAVVSADWHFGLRGHLAAMSEVM